MSSAMKMAAMKKKKKEFAILSVRWADGFLSIYSDLQTVGDRKVVGELG